ncbi:uncharacterized protein LOC128271543 [Anopheles cruzii]|uniref:uncharacterized protein LOC128271543 n=1 Tax=Anopheles cruzii TaxID=68878 RepID=UPI0022EC8F07|nr:uncharacterized protein LOC128271543 [Anopheles cruzii]
MATYRSEVVGFLALVISCCFDAGSASLFPHRTPLLDVADPLMPNEERSVRDCPFTIYPYGGYALASSIFADRYVDKTYSHTVRVQTGETGCVGIIVDENHVLTKTECVDENDPPVVKLTNDTLAAIEVAEAFSNPDINVTLLRLNSSIECNSLAVPACFWDVPFEHGFEKLQHIFASPNGTLTMEETKCTFQNRKKCLDELLKSNSIVQTRAISDYRMHPFVLSFGQDETGLSVPVSKYLDWLGRVTKNKISTSECVSKYNQWREYEDSMVSRSDNYQSVQYSKGRFSSTILDMYKVRIVPSGTQKTSKRHCYGSLIGPKFILTAANCLKHPKGQTFEVEMGQIYAYPSLNEGITRVRASKVHYHPEFDSGTLANDIALLELVKPVHDLTPKFMPACIWTHDKFPVEEFQTNGYTPFNETIEIDRRTKQWYGMADLYKECPSKVGLHRICAGFPTALAPGTCHNSIGSAMSRSLYTYDRFYEYIFAINSQGENCGFNWPTVFTHIAPYVQWIDSVIFASKVRYEDLTGYYGDRCQDENGVNGTCVSVKQCPVRDREAQEGKVVMPSPNCSPGNQIGMVVCCSDENLLRDESQRAVLSQTLDELQDCSNLYHEFRQNKSRFGRGDASFPYAVRIYDGNNGSCNGTIVAKQFVITTAGCHRRLTKENVTVVAGNFSFQYVPVPVQSAFVHPEYTDEPTHYNLVLLKLQRPLAIDNATIPACLWNDHSHTPLRLEEVYGSAEFTNQFRFPMFTHECQRKFSANMTSMQLCVQQDKMFYQGYRQLNFDAGSALISHFGQAVLGAKNEERKVVPYLVGLFGASRTSVVRGGDSEEKDYVQAYDVYQRMSEYYYWIKNVIAVAIQQP